MSTANYWRRLDEKADLAPSRPRTQSLEVVVPWEKSSGYELANRTLDWTRKELSNPSAKPSVYRQILAWAKSLVKPSEKSTGLKVVVEISDRKKAKEMLERTLFPPLWVDCYNLWLDAGDGYPEAYGNVSIAFIENRIEMLIARHLVDNR